MILLGCGERGGQSPHSDVPNLVVEKIDVYEATEYLSVVIVGYNVLNLGHYVLKVVP